MPSRSKSRDVSDEIANIEEQISELKDKLRDLGTTSQGADVNDFVNDALETIMKRVRNNSDVITDDVAQRAAKAGNAAFQRIVEEVEHYPLATLAVAAGIGFLLGSARR